MEKTVIDLINEVNNKLQQSECYFGHGTDNSWDEAVALVSYVLFFGNEISTKEAKILVSEKKQKEIFNLLEQRINQRKPLSYLTNTAYFAGLKFYVNENVLIPRSPLAELIEEFFQPWKNPDEIHSILDCCTGSGCIAIACAKSFPNIEVDASDISEKALCVAKKNVNKHNVGNQVNLIQSDLFKQIPKKEYNVIIVNPPYVSKEEFNNLPQEYYHEPKLALFSDENGLEIVDRILGQAYNYLTSGGLLIVEVGNAQGNLLEKYPNVPFLWPEFSCGEGSVFLLTKEQLFAHFAE